MLIEGQKIEMKWSTSNRYWYESKGYKFTKYRDVFEVNAEDLMATSKSKVKIMCDYCGDVYETNYAVYYNGINVYPKNACSKCAGKKAQEVNQDERAQKYFDQISKICEDNNYVLLSAVEDCYDIRNNKITYICSKHGEQKATIDNFLRGHYCKKCKDEFVGKLLRKNLNDVEKEINSFNNNVLLNKNEYIEAHVSNLKILCGICGDVYTTSLVSYRKTMHMCPSCTNKESKNEKVIKDVFKRFNIDFIQEKRFDDCRDIKPLPFDFYLPQYNLCVEYDGEGHYLESFYESRFDNSKAALEHTQRHDQIKTQYCKDNKINLLRIPYWEKENMEKIILDYLNLYDNQCV